MRNLLLLAVLVGAGCAEQLPIEKLAEAWSAPPPGHERGVLIDGDAQIEWWYENGAVVFDDDTLPEERRNYLACIVNPYAPASLTFRAPGPYRPRDGWVWTGDTVRKSSGDPSSAQHTMEITIDDNFKVQKWHATIVKNHKTIAEDSGGIEYNEAGQMVRRWDKSGREFLFTYKEP